MPLIEDIRILKDVLTTVTEMMYKEVIENHILNNPALQKSPITPVIVVFHARLVFKSHDVMIYQDYQLD
jgi:hypothetical protein